MYNKVRLKISPPCNYNFLMDLYCLNTDLSNKISFFFNVLFKTKGTIQIFSKTKTYIHGEIFDGGSIDCGGLKSDRPLVLHNRLSPANSGLMIVIISFFKSFL